MRTLMIWAWSLWLAMAVTGAERRFDFGEFKENEPPPGFRSTVSGEGKPGDWRIILDEVPSAMQTLTPQAPAVSKRAVLAQLGQNPADEHFPLLIFEEETFGDFTLTTRFKTVRGAVEQMAGIAFRIQNETNYYVVRASSLGNTYRFYKVVDGQRGTIIGPEIAIPAGVWHELSIECKGNQINCRLNGKDAIPTLTDSSFSSGKIGFWTKSDSVSYFVDTRIVYTPRQPPALAIVREMMKKYPRLLGLKVYSLEEGDRTRVIASSDEQDLKQPGSKTELNTITQGSIYYVKNKGSVAVIMPLRDRNGDPIAAVRVIMTTFTGQTEQSAVIRATPIVKEMQARVQAMDDLLQ
ncbi:MAG TPA: family 16 glycoside hydrolase [Clostridia bacterium]|nr:family 16 glycoside hydrolase [Clostridia bacterium]